MKVLEKRIGEATHTDESFLLGGFDPLWTLKHGEQCLVLRQRELMLTRGARLERAVRGFALSLFQRRVAPAAKTRPTISLR